MFGAVCKQTDLYLSRSVCLVFFLAPKKAGNPGILGSKIEYNSWKMENKGKISAISLVSITYLISEGTDSFGKRHISEFGGLGIPG